MEKMLIIYRAHFTNSDKCYIGITNNLENRKRQHLKDTLRGADRKFHKAIKKYGEPIFEILETCQTINELYDAEKRYISQYDSFKNGYNSTLGGEGTFGSPRPKNKTWRKNQSIKMSGSGNPRYGIKLDDDFKKTHSNLMKEYYQNNPNKKAWGNKSAMNMIWINDGIIEKKINKKESIPEKFNKGRLFKNRKGRKQT